MDYSTPGSSIHGIPQARVLKWVAIPFSRGSPQPRNWTWVSCTARRFFTNWATRKARTLLAFNFEQSNSSKNFKNFMILYSLHFARVSEGQTFINFQFHPTWTCDIYIYIYMSKLVEVQYIVGPISFHSIVLKFICRIEWNQFYGGLYSAFLDFFLNLSSLPYSLKYKFIVFIVVVQALSHLRLYNHMNCSMPDFLVLHHLPDIVQTHVRWVNDAIQSFHLLSPPSPPALNLF